MQATWNLPRKCFTILTFTKNMDLTSNDWERKWSFLFKMFMFQVKRSYYYVELPSDILSFRNEHKTTWEEKEWFLRQMVFTSRVLLDKPTTVFTFSILIFKNRAFWKRWRTYDFTDRAFLEHKYERDCCGTFSLFSIKSDPFTLFCLVFGRGLSHWNCSHFILKMVS